MRLETNKKDEIRNIIKQQSKLTFNGIHKSKENCDSYTFKQNEVVMDKAIIVDFTILELSKLHMYETYYDTLQPYFGQEKLQLHYFDAYGMILSTKTENFIKDIKKIRRYIRFQ